MRALFISLVFLCSLGNYVLGQQNACVSGQSFKIVVLGSSTSAGAGASVPDSAWVNRYASYLQEINPNNEVVNLGVGGYNTYRIMPTGYVPPAGRPAPDATKNITAALTENPDAIIINMPSNDVALGFSYSEQMFNLDTIVSIAQQSNVPIWVCTTQPRNFSNQTQLDLQWEIKDSIYAYFNPYTIDFWSTIATPGYTIDPAYDSGDGVHLNDVGHGILADRVIQTSILDSIVLPPDTVDYAILDMLVSSSVCGDSITAVQLVVANVGLEDTTQTTVDFQSVNTLFSTSELNSYQYSNGLPACSFDTLLFTFNTHQVGNYQFNATISNSLDSIASNNVLETQIVTSGHPDPYILNDTLCVPGMAQLFALATIGDETFWYDDTSGTPLINDDLLTLPFVDTTSLYYVQVVRGDLFYKESLATSLNSNINFNGTMFDLVATDSIVVDSFDVKINSPGMQGVEVFYKQGTHLGFETNAAAWTLLDDAMVNVSTSNQWTTVPIGGLSIAQGDTVAIHLRMQNAGSNLSYQSVSAPQTRSTSELIMITGSGVSANFANNYFPRDWSGGVYYHHGYRPLGDCATDMLEAVVVLSEFELFAGNDTIIDIEDTLIAQATAGFETYDWSNGSDSSQAVIIASDLGAGVHFIDLYAMDSLGCEHYDEFVVAVADLVGMDEENSSFSIVPNPVRDEVTIQTTHPAEIYFTDFKGNKISVRRKNGQSHQFSLKHLPAGVYLVHVIENGRHQVQKLVKVE
ncbi:MAG: GDSL-type esterase/lipase family protein [bacterium]|nr:GDSL-type esterase/lipase family protein [bacterium]